MFKIRFSLKTKAQFTRAPFRTLILKAFKPNYVCITHPVCLKCLNRIFITNFRLGELHNFYNRLPKFLCKFSNKPVKFLPMAMTFDHCCSGSGELKLGPSKQSKFLLFLKKTKETKSQHRRNNLRNF